MGETVLMIREKLKALSNCEPYSLTGNNREALAKRKIRMDESVLDGRVAVLLPLNEAEFSDRDFAINESILIYMEEHEKAPSPIELMDIMNTNKLSDVYLQLKHLQDIGVIGYAPKMPNPIVIVRGM